MPKYWRVWCDVPAWEASILYSPHQNEEAVGQGDSTSRYPYSKRNCLLSNLTDSAFQNLSKKVKSGEVFLHDRGV